MAKISVATSLPLPPDDARGVLAPAAGRGAQVHAAHSGVQQPLPLLDLQACRRRASASLRRSRAVFKLMQIQERERLLRPGIRLVDLGAAPGGGSEYAARIVGGKSRIVATDILPMDAIPGVEFVQGDFREPPVLGQVLAVRGRR